MQAGASRHGVVQREHPEYTAHDTPQPPRRRFPTIASRPEHSSGVREAPPIRRRYRLTHRASISHPHVSARANIRRRASVSMARRASTETRSRARRAALYRCPLRSCSTAPRTCSCAPASRRHTHVGTVRERGHRRESGLQRGGARRVLDRGSGGGDRTQRRTDALVPTPVTVGGAVRRRHALTRGPASGALRACSLGEQRVGGLCSPLAQRRRRPGITSKRSGHRPCYSVGSVWRLYRAPRTARNARALLSLS